jgi:hypothetical protein
MRAGEAWRAGANLRDFCGLARLALNAIFAAHLLTLCYTCPQEIIYAIAFRRENYRVKPGFD